MKGPATAAAARAAATAAGLLFAALALWAGALHPVAPVPAVALLCAVAAWTAWRPADLWFLLPAALPVASFAPWTGWWLIDESDLLILAALGGSYLRWGRDGWVKAAPNADRPPPAARWVGVALLLVLLAGIWRGLDDARGALPWPALLADLRTEGLYGDYDLPGNTLRVSKSLAWALLLMPVLARADRGAPLRLARGMVAGLCLVCAAVLWERAVYAGALDFSHQYRTSAWFWEMHVGGGAIDAYLAMALPFAFWAAWVAPRGWRWCAAAGLVLVSMYAVLTTFSRGVCLAVLLALAAMAVLPHLCRLVPPGRLAGRQRAMLGLLLALAGEAAAVLFGGSHMSDRLARSDTDLYHRVAHWQRGLGLLKTPGDWLLGLGAGRLPAHYAQTPEGALPGQVRWARDREGHSQAWLHGPAWPQTPGRLALAQRVDLAPGGAYRVRLRAALDPGAHARLELRLCERHLLYAFECQSRVLHLLPVLPPRELAGRWIDLRLHGPAFASGEGLSRLRGGVFTVAAPEAGASVRVQTVELIDPQGRQVLHNPDFAQGPRHWSTVADGNYLPWHIDNLFLELLIERGLLGLLALAAVAVHALALAVRGIRRRNFLALAVAVALSAVFLLGSLISVMEIPRVALLLWLLAVSAMAAREGEDLARGRLQESTAEAG